MQPTLLAEMFLVEAEGISLCLRVLEPGRSVSVLVASMECVLQAASNPEEFVRELVADQVLEHEGGGKPPRYRWHLSCILLKMPAISLSTGADRIAAAMAAVAAPRFHAVACRVLTCLLISEENVTEWSSTAVPVRKPTTPN